MQEVEFDREIISIRQGLSMQSTNINSNEEIKFQSLKHEEHRNTGKWLNLFLDCMNIISKLHELWEWS